MTEKGGASKLEDCFGYDGIQRAGEGKWDNTTRVYTPSECDRHNNESANNTFADVKGKTWQMCWRPKRDFHRRKNLYPPPQRWHTNAPRRIVTKPSHSPHPDIIRLHQTNRT
jgi:hypothetical protein